MEEENFLTFFLVVEGNGGSEGYGEANTRRMGGGGADRQVGRAAGRGRL